MTQTIPQNLAFNADKVPESLKIIPRWAPWEAIWLEKKQKYTKVPRSCRAPHYGLSTAKPERWGTFAEAQKAMTDNPGKFAGLGLCVTGQPDLVGIDLDRCVENNTIAPWAKEIITQTESYVELSPSGKGLRIWCAGNITNDWTNHDQGIEVYGGNEPRFLTVTGQRLHISPDEVAPVDPAALAALRVKYAREKAPSATITSLVAPDLMDELALPGLDTLGLPYQAREFLEDGKHRGDRSRELFHTSIALYAAGLNDAEVFSYLVNSPHALEVALDHRNQDHDRALMFLWVEQCQKAKPRAASRVASADDFEYINEPATQAKPAQSATQTIAKPIRFQFSQAAEYLNRAPVSWLIKRVLPRGDVGAIFGESGAGKSFFALDLVMAIAQGSPWRGHDVRQGTVAYIVAEGAGGFTVRLRAYAEHHGVDLAASPVHILGDAPNFLEKGDIKDLLAALRQLPALSVVVVDTLAQVTAGGNENSGEDMGRALAHCKVLSKATGAMVLLVAHSGKDSTRGLRGWSGIKGALDVEILVERSDKYRSATVTKMKDGEGEGEEFAFSLGSVHLGVDDEGDAITSCVVQHGATVPKGERKTQPKGVWQQLVMRVAQTLTDLPGDVTTTQLIDACVSEIPAEDGKKDRRRERVFAAIESLVAGNHLSAAGGMVGVL